MSYQYEPAEFDRREDLLGDRRELDEAPPQRLPRVAAALFVMALFAAGLWLAYYAGTRHLIGSHAGAVPLIRADARPMIVKPAAPGGLKIPDRNMLIYDPNQRMVEHLLPPPEAPMARPGAATSAPPSSPSGTTPPTAAPIPETAPAAVSAKADAVAKSTLLTNPAGPGRGGNVRLQLGSVRSADAARLEWDRIRGRNRDLLGALSASPVRTDLGGDKGVYWRIETRPVGDLAAGRICNALRERKFGCLIVR